MRALQKMIPVLKLNTQDPSNTISSMGKVSSNNALVTRIYLVSVVVFSNSRTGHIAIQEMRLGL